MKNQLILLLIAVFFAACQSSPGTEQTSGEETVSDSSTVAANTLMPEEEAAGWQLLFDGTSTAEWRGYNLDSMPALGWTVKDGALVIEKTPDPKPEGFGGDIITKEKFGNFEFMVDFMISDSANSGIFYFVMEEQDTPMWHNAPEFQILDNATYANFYDINKHSTGDNYDLQSSTEDYMKPVGEWNTARIVHKDGHVEHWLNGNKCLEYQVGSPEWEALVKKSKFKDYPSYGRTTPGHLGLQDHHYEVRFRNIKVREL
ncbi:MAG: family 16 glycoside hydrolase [Saprospiraceae bacterium]